MVKTKKLTNEEIASLSNASIYDFPKYATQIINLVNGNAQGTRPKVVGQMSELIQEFNGHSLEEWIEWYSNGHPTAVQNATNKIYEKFVEMKAAFDAIDKDMIQKWVEDLVYNKTYCGLKFQQAIIEGIASELNVDSRLANETEESQGVDGFINDKPVQIKADTYKNEGRLNEVINVYIIYYKKTKTGITIEYDPDVFK